MPAHRPPMPARLALTAATAAAALAAVATTASAGPGVSVELNKLEKSDKGCRVYLVINNSADSAYQAYKLDLVLFQPDGVIGKRLSLDLAPIRAAKRTVKLFDLEGVACDQVGSLLVNDMLDCRTDAGAQNDCLAGLTLSSLTNVKLSK